MKILELTIRTLCDLHPETKADVAFLFSQTRDNQDSVFIAAQKLLHHRLARKLLIVQSAAKSGYPGHRIWLKALNQMGVSRNLIGMVDLQGPATLNTLIEARALIHHAQKKSIQKAYVVAAPFHQVRAFMTVVTIALQDYPEIRLFSYPGPPLCWQHAVAHSQGQLTAPRKGLIQAELDRIRIYQEKGDLASETAVLDYLDQRDTAEYPAIA